MTTEMSSRFARGRSAFTLTDLLAIAAVLSVGAALVTVRLNGSKQAARLARCTENLHQVDRAVLTFGGEHQETLPAAGLDTGGSLWWWYKEQVKHFAGLTSASSTNDLVFACPSDRGYSDPGPFWANPRFDYNSYVYNGVTLPGMPHIAGAHLPSIVDPAKTLLVMEWTAHAPLSWHASRTGRRNMPFYRDARSVLGFVDGHVSFSPIYYDGYNAAYTRDPMAGYDYKYSGH